VIHNEAIHSFQKTYAQYGIDVTYATFHGGSAFSGYAQIPDQEFVAYVVGDYPFPGSGKSPTSVVYYFALMEGAQEALGQPSDPNTGSGWINFSPSYPPQDPIAFQNMLHALGKGIGNAAAHEMGHHLEDIGAPSNNIFPNMDCGAGNDQGNTAPPVPCENGDNFVYAFYKSSGLPQYGGTSSGGMFFYGVPGGTNSIPLQPAIHWGPSDDCWIRKYTGLSCGGQ
jgi:hypothetical protein